MEEKKKSGFATAGLALGIIGVCTSFIPIVNNLSFILALIGILFGIVSLIKKASKKTAVAGMIICILAIIFTIQSQQKLVDTVNDAVDDMSSSFDDLSGKNTDEILEKYLDVDFGKFESDDAEYFVTTKLNVRVTNKAEEKKSYTIKVEAVAEDGTRIDTDTVYANDLNAGQSQNLEAFTLISSDKIEQLKKATFKVVEVSMY